MGVMTWFLSHDHAHGCNIGRHVELGPDPGEWQERILHAWNDEIYWHDEVEFFLVTPRPFDLEQNVAAHLLVVQHEQSDSPDGAFLLSLYDSAVHAGHAIRFAFISNKQISHAALVAESDRTVVCSWNDVVCQSWFGWFSLNNIPCLPAHNGYGFMLSVLRQARQEHPHILSLDNLIPIEDQQRIVELLPRGQHPCMPPFVELPMSYNEETLRKELRHWGFDCEIHLCGPHDKAICFIEDDRNHDSTFTYVFINDDVTDSEGVFLHSAPHRLSEIEIMRVLHQMLYQRAVILEHTLLRGSLYKIHFLNVHSNTNDKKQDRTPSPWPMPQPKAYDRSPVTAHLQGLADHAGSYALTLQNSIADLRQLLTSGQGLCQDWTGLELPDHVLQALQTCSPWEPHICLDRLIIYTDGTSSGHRHSIPDKIDSEDTLVDSWAFAVLGERYTTPTDPGGLFFLGWQSQPVL